MEVPSALSLPLDLPSSVPFIANNGTVDSSDLVSTLNITDFTKVSAAGDNGTEPGEKVNNIYVWLWPVQIAIFLFTLVGNIVLVYAVCAVKRFRR